jgi:hypothetical protein
VALLLALAPVTSLINGPRSLYHSRHDYMPAAAIALLVGLALEGLALRRPRLLRVAFAAGLAFLAAAAQLNIGHWARNARLADAIVHEVAGAIDAGPEPAASWSVTGYSDMRHPYFLFHGLLGEALAVARPDLRGRARCVDAFGCVAFSDAPPGPLLVVTVDGWNVARVERRERP